MSYFVFRWPCISVYFLLITNLTHFSRCIYLFHFSTCFEQPSAHHQESRIVSIHHLVYITLCRWLAGMLVRKDLTVIPGSHQWYIPDDVLIQFDSPDDEHWVPRNMYRSEINKKIHWEKCVKLVVNKNNMSYVALLIFNGISLHVPYRHNQN